MRAFSIDVENFKLGVYFCESFFELKENSGCSGARSVAVFEVKVTSKNCFG